MAATGIPIPIWSLVNASGAPVSGAKVYSWVPDSNGAPTATARALFTDASATVPAANPYTLGTNGGGTLYRLPSQAVTIQVKSADAATTYSTTHLPVDLNQIELDTSWNTLLSSVSTKALALLDGIKKFATYAALIAMTAATGLIANGLYVAEARAAADDGGYGMFQWREGDSTTANGGTVLAHATLPGGAGGGRFHRLHVGSWVDLRWWPGGAPGSDCSAAMAAAMATGKHVYVPRLSSTWVVGSGTSLPAFVSRQWIITDNVEGAVTQITFSVAMTPGALATRCDDAGIGAGFSIIAPTDREFIDGIYFRTFTIGSGLVAGSHQAAKLGNASAAGGSYRFYNHADVSQRYGRIVVTGASGTFTAGRIVTGGTSGATGTIEAWESGTGTLTLSSTSATSFSAAETITEATSGYTATVSTVYRPDHIFKALNFLGDFTSDATVEGAFDGASDGFHADSNTASRVDEMHISKYFARCRRAVSFEDARGVNLHFYGDFEGCLQAGFWFVVTSSTAKSVGNVGYSQVYIKAEKIHVGSAGVAGVVMKCDRAGVELEVIDLDLSGADYHTVTGVQINFSQSTLRSCKIRLSGVLNPTGTRYGVEIVEGASATIIGLDVEVALDQQGGATALAALVHITGTPEGRIGQLIGAGTVTAKLVMNVTPSKNLRIEDSESGVPIGASALYGPDFGAVDITVADADFDLRRGGAGGVLIWRPEMDIRIIGSDWEFSAAPTANHIDVKIDVAGVNVKAHTNTGVVTQSESYWASGDIVVTKGQAVELYVRPDATYATANVDAIGRLKYVPLWNDA